MKLNIFNQNIPVSRIHEWMRLCISLLLLWLIVLIVIPWITRLPMINTLVESNKAQSIDATGFFYSDTREFAQSENYLRNLDVQN